MLDDHNASEHVYDSALAEHLMDSILALYIPAFKDLLKHLDALYDPDTLNAF